MNTKVMAIADIIPAGYNPRVQLKRGDTQFEALRNSIERFGLVEPLIVNSRNNVLIGGHQRLSVLKENGVTETEVILVDLDEQKEKALNLALNKIDGEWDFDKLDDLLEGLEKDDIRYTGFTEEEVFGAYQEDYFEDLPEEPSKSTSEKEKTPQEPSDSFVIYLSFPDKESADEWLKAEGTGKTANSRNVTIKMVGTQYA
jgi:hypothetical protein